MSWKELHLETLKMSVSNSKIVYILLRNGLSGNLLKLKIHFGFSVIKVKALQCLLRLVGNVQSLELRLPGNFLGDQSEAVQTLKQLFVAAHCVQHLVLDLSGNNLWTDHIRVLFEDITWTHLSRLLLIINNNTHIKLSTKETLRTYQKSFLVFQALK